MISINLDSRLYIISAGEGFTCMGFDNCFYDSLQLSQKLNQPSLAPIKEEIGSKAQYEQYRTLLKIARSSPSMMDTWFTPGTSSDVKKILESARNNNNYIRLFFGDKVSGKDWMEESDVYGKIGRSMGTLKVPLLMRSGEHYGSAISTDAIVKIIRFTRSNTAGRSQNVLYCHKSYHQPCLSIVEQTAADYPIAVTSDGEIYAQFATVTKAQKWVDFMEGRVAKP
jgi:hypothetical protein